MLWVNNPSLMGSCINLPLKNKLGKIALKDTHKSRLDSSCLPGCNSYITAGSITLSHRWTCFCELENVSSSCWSLLLFYPPVTCSISRAWNTFSLYFHWFNPTRKSWSCHKLYLPLSHGASVRVLQQAADHPKFPGGAGSM